MQLELGFGELEDPREFELIDERKKALDCLTSAFLFLFCNEFFFLVKLYDEYRM